MGRLVVHWSPFHGQAKTTSSMSAVAMAMSHISNDRVCVSHTQYGMADLEGMFDSRPTIERKSLLYQAAGLNALIANIKRDRLTKEDVEGCTIGTMMKNVDLLPGIEVKEIYADHEETDLLVYKIFTESVKNCYDWVFVDLAAGNRKQSIKFMDAADVIVVTLSQNVATWEMFFEQYPEIATRPNVFYLIGGHKEESSFSSKNFSRMYQQYGTRLKSTGVVPDCVGYMDAISEGHVSHFFVMNVKASKREENSEFMRECMETAMKLRTFAGAEPVEFKSGR